MAVVKIGEQNVEYDEIPCAGGVHDWLILQAAALIQPGHVGNVLVVERTSSGREHLCTVSHFGVNNISSIFLRERSNERLHASIPVFEKPSDAHD